jgi:glycosyltransferase involved in cell wall biosynthesis
MRKRIALFIRSMDGGGAQRMMVRYASGFARVGFQVDVLCLFPEGPFRTELDTQVRVLPLRSKRIAGAIPEVAQYLRRQRPDAMMVTEPACNVAVILARMLARSRTRLLVREGLFPSIAARQSPHRATRLAYRLAPLLYRRADVIVAIAEEMAADLARFIRVPPARITTIAVNPVVTASLAVAAARPVDHAWLADGRPVILSVGRLDEQKDFSTLIRAFEKVRAVRDCRLLILGEGPHRAQLEALQSRSQYASDIDLPGFDPNPFAYMARCAVFVLSSRYEGLPNSLIEALACGASCVATDCPSGPRDILDGERYGALVPVGDPAAMAEAIARALAAPMDRGRLRQRGNQYTVEHSVSQYLAVLLP